MKFLRPLTNASVFIVLLPVILMKAPRTFEPDLFVRLAGLATAIFGGYMCLRGYLVLSVFGQGSALGDTDTLVTEYIYRSVRHPIYLGYSAFWLGIGLMTGSVWIIGAGTGLALVFASYCTVFEEPQLVRRFAEEYIRYRKAVPCIVPSFRGIISDATELRLITLAVMAFLKMLFRLIWRIEAQGTHNIPRTGRAIIACNHMNLFDPFFLGAFSGRPIHFMASDELFRNAAANAFFHALGAFPKKRWGMDIGALKKFHRLLADGRLAGIFPEGQRSYDGGALSTGDEVYHFLHRAGAEIVCATLIGAHEAMPRWAPLPSFVPITVRFYPAINPADYKDHIELRAAMEERMFGYLEEPPRHRKVNKSIRGITKVVWGCIDCGYPSSPKVKGSHLICPRCGAKWHVNSGLELEHMLHGIRMREWEYHAELREVMSRGCAIEFTANAKAYRVESSTRLTPMGEGRLTLAQGALQFESHKASIALNAKDIRFVYPNLLGHIVVAHSAAAYEFTVFRDSPVKWHDCISIAAGRPLRHWVPPARAQREAR